MEEDIFNYLPTVMFSGTTCMSLIKNKDDNNFVFHWKTVQGVKITENDKAELKMIFLNI